MTTCRLCGSNDLAGVVDLDVTPPCALLPTVEHLDEPEVTYSLHSRVCSGCLLTQLRSLISPEETFTEHAGVKAVRPHKPISRDQHESVHREHFPCYSVESACRAAATGDPPRSGARRSEQVDRPLWTHEAGALPFPVPQLEIVEVNP